MLSQKTSHLRWKKRFQEIIPFDTHSTEKVKTFSVYGKNSVSFEKKTFLSSQKKPKFCSF